MLSLLFSFFLVILLNDDCSPDITWSNLYQVSVLTSLPYDYLTFQNIVTFSTKQIISIPVCIHGYRGDFRNRLLNYLKRLHLVIALAKPIVCLQHYIGLWQLWRGGGTRDLNLTEIITKVVRVLSL